MKNCTEPARPPKANLPSASTSTNAPSPATKTRHSSPDSSLPLKMAPAGKTAKTAAKHKFVIDYSRPASDGVFDGAAFEKYLHDRIKVEGKTGQLGDSIKIHRNGDTNITVTSNVAFSKRYLKYLTKKFLKKNTLRDWIRVVATTKDNYQLRFYNIQTGDDEEEE
ncbi:hypothetical protein EIP91_000646 [Steccherinum ochraceum]|uniref:60S ribosomal protein L22 n=1 Tax=Steccherinum ochraceum TaxID=92696 RepID=A0A4R0RHX3_9APHY|nr:hypothetical protein EIP91_000646 [Steccherinum ochraceum]